MVKKQFIVILYFLVALIYIIAALLRNESLELIFKPIFIPILFFYYLEKVKKRISYWVLISLCFFYCGEMLTLIGADEFYLQSLVFFLIPYLIFLNIIGNDFLKLFKIEKFSLLNLSVILVACFLVFLLVSVINMLSITNVAESVLIIGYGISLVLMCLISVVFFAIKDCKSSFYALLTVMAFIVSDLFYIFNKKIDSNFVFHFVNLVTQILSYYFYIKFFILRAKNK